MKSVHTPTLEDLLAAFSRLEIVTEALIIEGVDNITTLAFLSKLQYVKLFVVMDNPSLQLASLPNVSPIPTVLHGGNDMLCESSLPDQNNNKSECFAIGLLFSTSISIFLPPSTTINGTLIATLEETALTAVASEFGQAYLAVVANYLMQEHVEVASVPKNSSVRLTVSMHVGNAIFTNRVELGKQDTVR